MKQSLYRQVASDIAGDISHGVYPAGTKVPSVRVLSQRLKVSISTVTQAYGLLEDQGLIRSRPQSGYFVREQIADPSPPVSQGGQPSVVTKDGLIDRLLRQSLSGKVLNLGTAVPDISFLPHRAIQTHIQKTARFERDKIFGYHISPGLLELRQAIAQRMSDIRVRCHGDDVLITNGATEAINLCLRACAQPGDVIAIESPCYYGYLQIAKQLGLQVVEIPTDPSEGMSLSALQLALNQWPIKAILLSTRYSNPTGALLPEDMQRKIYGLAKQQQVPIIEDDVYGELGFDGGLGAGGRATGGTTIKHYDDEGLVMFCSSFSKTLSPGMRVGWCVAGKKMEALVQAQMYSNWAVNSISQLAILSYLNNGNFDKHLRNLRAISQENIRSASYFIHRHFPEGTLMTSPAGGFVLWLKLPHGANALALHEAALAQGIGLAPGGLFSNSSYFDDHLRINCALPWDAILKPALTSLAGLVGGA